MPEFLTERQMTQNSPRWIRQALLTYRDNGGDETLFLRGVYFMQIMATLAPAGFLRPADYQVAIEASYQQTEWSVWHQHLLLEMRYFISAGSWVFLWRKYQRLQRKAGLGFLLVKNWLGRIFAQIMAKVSGTPRTSLSLEKGASPDTS